MSADTASELGMYYVCFQEEGGSNHDEWVVAGSPSEAFALWREDLRADDIDISRDDGNGIRVFVAPLAEHYSSAQSLMWPHNTVTRFEHDYEDLTTRAVEATIKAMEDTNG